MSSTPDSDAARPAPAAETDDEQSPGPGRDRDRVVVVTPEGMAVAGSSDADSNPAMLVEQPAKVMRIGNMIKQLLEEVHSAPLDEAGRARLAAIHERAIQELEKGLAPELVDELRSMSLPFDDTAVPSDAELRIAQAQLVGWLEGLFHGIQTVLFAQQMAARTQLEQMRRALPGGPATGLPPGMAAGQGQGGPQVPPGPGQNTGQYL